MKNLKFKYLAAENFFCFGSPGIELELENYGNIVLIRGNNLDVDGEEEKIAGNGSGKSSCQEILVYTLFGKTVKHPKKIKHNDCINNSIGKNLKTEVRWDNFRVVRTRKPDSLRIWENKDGIWDDEHEITLGGMPATQELIEEKLGLNYQTFVKVAVFTDDKSNAFLECDSPTKREIVENLLSLDVYRNYSQVAKDIRNEIKGNIKEISSQYDGKLAVLDAAKKRVEEYQNEEKKWQDQRKQELGIILNKAKKVKEELESTDVGAAITRYEEAQSRLEEIKSKIPELTERQASLNQMIETAQEKLETTKQQKRQKTNEFTDLKHTISKNLAEIKDYENSIETTLSKTGTTCPECFSEVNEDNFSEFVSQMKEKITCATNTIKENQTKQKPIEQDILKLDGVINKYEEAIKVAKTKREEVTKQLNSTLTESRNLSSIEKPKSDVNEAVLQKQLQTLKEQAFEKQRELEGETPYVKIIHSAQQEVEERKVECENKKSELKDIEAELPYYEFWVTAFGDKGIRKFIIEGIIPALNARIAHWLQFLIDGKIKVNFDSELEETIERIPFDGNPFVYPAMSGGQKQRINLAVSQAFAHVMMLNTGTSPSVVFLDEVTTNIDPIGVIGIYNMISELSKERQVFVTTHDQGLLDLLDGCSEINLEMKDGFTKLVNAV